MPDSTELGILVLPSCLVRNTGCTLYYELR